MRRVGTRVVFGVCAVIVVAFVVAGTILTGGDPKRQAPRWLVDRPFAHRGLHDLTSRPENSLAAFDAAADAGYGVELDVHLSADGVPVVIHDDDTARVTGRDALVAELSAEELTGLRLLGSVEHVPTLDEALEAIDGRVPLLIEIKNEGDIGYLEDAVSASIADYDGKVAVMSFNPYSVAHFITAAPAVPRGQLSSHFANDDLATYKKLVLRFLLMNWMSRPDFVAYEIGETPSAATRIQRLHGRPLLVWTAESPEDAAKAKQVADNVIANPGGLPDLDTK